MNTEAMIAELRSQRARAQTPRERARLDQQLRDAEDRIPDTGPRAA